MKNIQKNKKLWIIAGVIILLLILAISLTICGDKEIGEEKNQGTETVIEDEEDAGQGLTVVDPEGDVIDSEDKENSNDSVIDAKGDKEASEEVYEYIDYEEAVGDGEESSDDKAPSSDKEPSDENTSSSDKNPSDNEETSDNNESTDDDKDSESQDSIDGLDEEKENTNEGKYGEFF